MTCPEGTLTFDFSTLDRSRLSGSPFGALAPEEKVVDLFCGAGGWGDGLASVGISTDFAINHDAVAIEFHQRNHPQCSHHQGDAWRTKPRAVVGNAIIGLLLASAACTPFSRAKGAAPVSKRVHMLGTCILRWMKETSPRLVLVENVAEWMDWGPIVAKTHANGKPKRDEQGRILYTIDPERRGTKWRWWLQQARKLGYALDFKVLDAADFGSASRRKRLFVMLRRDGQPIVWPEITHAQVQRTSANNRNRGRGGRPDREECRRDGEQVDRKLDRVGDDADRRAPNRHRAAAEIIDFSDLGCSIFAGRREIEEYRRETGVRVRRPLKPKSLERIAGGVFKHVFEKANPFTLRVTQTGPKCGWKVVGIDAPLSTLTTRQDIAFCSPVVAVGRGEARTQSVADPLPTVTAGNGPGRGAGAGHSLGVISSIVAPLNTGVIGTPADNPAPTITTRGHQAMVSALFSPCGGPTRNPEAVDGPMATVLTREDRGVAFPVLATTGYGERQGQAPRVRDVREPIGTVVNGAKEGVATPVMTYMRSGGGQSSDARDPMLCPTAGGLHAGVVTPLCIGAGGSAYAAKPTAIDVPLNTVKCDDRRSLVAPLMAEYHGSGSGQTLQRADEPLGAVTTVEGRGIVAVRLDINHPRIRRRALQTARFLRAQLGEKVRLNPEGFAVTLVDGFEMVIVDILFRMLRVPELAAAMGFRHSYIWPKSQRDATRLIGNAVSPPQAKALVGAILPNGRGGREAVAA